MRNALWTWPLYAIAPLAAAVLFYIAGLIRMHRRKAKLRVLPIACFAAGWASLLVALDSPVHEISEQLFWVHMTQHEILMLVSAPLLVMAEPAATFLFGLPEWMRPVVARFSKAYIVRRLWSKISAPVAAWMIHALALWMWHAPRLFGAALANDGAHAIQHLSFLGSALLFWWTLIHKQAGNLGYGGGILYLFTTAIHTSLLGAWLTFSPTVWYEHYMETAPLWNLTALQDQQIGGLVMWIPAGSLLTIAALILLAKWLSHAQRRWEYTRTAELIRASHGVPE